MVTPVREVLARGIHRWGLEPAARLAEARRRWNALVGASLAEVSAPVGVRGKTLLVGVTHSAAGQEIRLRRAAILAGLAGKGGGGAFDDVRVVTRRRLGRPGARSG